MNPDDAPPCLVNWSGLTDRGRFRENNEDAVLALTFDAEGVRFLGKEGHGSLEEADFVFAVSDGMGGAKSGEFASRIAVDKITRLLPRSFHQRARGLPTGFSDILETLMHAIHDEMTSLGRIYEECHGMGATLTLGWFVPGWLYYAHIGDSRLYHLPASGGIRQITRDDSHVGWLRSTGQINEREARMHPRKNVLSRALGGGHQFAESQVGAVNCDPGDLFLFCTDGVIDGLWDRALLDTLREPDAAAAQRPPANRIVASAIAESGRDNTTAVVIGIT
ncbi:MAG: PP2C family protein-serine/threonine phosphatase [Verrucomicrobiota bacterium]